MAFFRWQTLIFDMAIKVSIELPNIVTRKVIIFNWKKRKLKWYVLNLHWQIAYFKQLNVFFISLSYIAYAFTLNVHFSKTYEKLCKIVVNKSLLMESEIILQEYVHHRWVKCFPFDYSYVFHLSVTLSLLKHVCACLVKEILLSNMVPHTGYIHCG